MARSIYCSGCKKEKEESTRNESYCKGCKSERAKRFKMKKRTALGLEPVRPEREAHCEDCKTKKSCGISIVGRCNSCTAITNKIRLHEKRLMEGKDPVPIRDSSFCHVCNIAKVGGRCIPCRRRSAKERKAKKREEAGKRPWGSGRPLTCYLCNAVKERPSASYCDSCTAKDNKRRWREISPDINAREVTLICECGKEKSSTRKFYCDSCIHTRKLERSRVAAQVRRDKLKEQGFIAPIQLLTEDERLMRKEARNYLNRLIRKGLMKRSNCEVCGSDKNLEAHHDDYSRPLDVVWLCRIHHDDYHHKTE